MSILLPQSSKRWNYRHSLPYPAEPKPWTQTLGTIQTQTIAYSVTVWQVKCQAAWLPDTSKYWHVSVNLPDKGLLWGTGQKGQCGHTADCTGGGVYQRSIISAIGCLNSHHIHYFSACVPGTVHIIPDSYNSPSGWLDSRCFTDEKGQRGVLTCPNPKSITELGVWGESCLPSLSSSHSAQPCRVSEKSSCYHGNKNKSLSYAHVWLICRNVTIDPDSSAQWGTIQGHTLWCVLPCVVMGKHSTTHLHPFPLFRGEVLSRCCASQAHLELSVVAQSGLKLTVLLLLLLKC